MGCQQSHSTSDPVTVGIKKVCEVCGKPETSSSILQRSFFWEQLYCTAHATEAPTERIRGCSSCRRYKPRNVEYINLGDGRGVCPDCFHISITNTEQCKPLVLHIHRFYEDHLKLDVEKNIPILLADVKEIARVTSKKRNPFTLGTTVKRTSAGVITTVKRHWRIGNSVKVDREQKQLTSNKVVAILLAFGLSKVVTGSTLAHEMMHAWFQFQGWYKGLEFEVEEGMCELAAYEWLKCWSPNDPSYTTEEAQFARTLHEFESLNIERRPFKMGDGFRAAKQAVEKYGFQNTLNHIARTGKFPTQ